MDILLIGLMAINLLLLILGFFSPKASLFWHDGERTRMKSLVVYGLFLITIIIVYGLWSTA